MRDVSQRCVRCVQPKATQTARSAALRPILKHTNARLVQLMHGLVGAQRYTLGAVMGRFTV